MIENFILTMKNYYEQNILTYFNELYTYPVKLIILVIDIAIVAFLLMKVLKFAKNSRAWQLLKGIIFLIVITWLSGLFKLTILNLILTSIMDFGVIALIVIFQPELRRALEQLGTNKVTRYFGFDKDIIAKTKEMVYKVAIASEELSKQRVGGLIVIERDIEIKDVINTGILIESEVSPQLITNIFTPKTPLHDGAVVISNNKIIAASCMLPLANDGQVAKELGTRHRAGMGISQESDAIAVVISEETGKISIGKDGTLIADVKPEALKKILIQHIVTKRFNENTRTSKERLKSFKDTFKKMKKSKKEENKKEDQE